MRIFIPSKLLILLAFMTSALLLAACSPSAEKLISQGNEAFSKEEYSVALHKYQSAQVESPELAEPYYNAANALYSEGAYAEALEQMQLALQHVDNETLAENSIYNLGNTFYNTQELDPAIESYISALLLDPDDQDAKYNLELALQEQQEQEQQQEQENQDQEQDQSESSENQDEEQQSQENQSQNVENEDQEQQEQDQENKSEQGSEEQSPENEDQQKEEQQNQDQNNGSGQPQESHEQSDQQRQLGQLPTGQRMTEEQARQLLEALAQNMDTLQERLGQILRVQIPPPVQDW